MTPFHTLFREITKAQASAWVFSILKNYNNSDTRKITENHNMNLSKFYKKDEDLSNILTDKTKGVSLKM